MGTSKVQVLLVAAPPEQIVDVSKAAIARMGEQLLLRLV